MGYQTDFIGYFQIDPPLNGVEMEVVNRISGSIYADRYGRGPRPIGDVEAAALALVRDHAPQSWSNWTSCPTGCCLSYDGGDKANHMIPWLRFLLQQLLVPGAAAAGAAGLTQFSCDHVLNGMVVGSRRDNGELYAISVRDNDVEVEMLWPGVHNWSAYPPLAYQESIDRFRGWAVEQKRWSPEYW